MWNKALGTLSVYCETLVYVTVIMMAAYTTGALSKIRNKSNQVFMVNRFPRSFIIIISAVLAFAGAAGLKLLLANFLGI